jgi:hypothetical protein
MEEKEQKMDKDVVDIERYFIKEEEMKDIHAKDASKWCCGTVSDTDKGNWCNANECARFMNQRFCYRCDGDECPIKPNTWYSISGACSDNQGAQKYMSACIVQFNNISTCS